MYIADLHIHSRYSRATSKDGTPEHLDLWARRKGIHILGTGDFTHPAWRAELKEKLTPAEEGLYTLKQEYRIEDHTAGDTMCPRFVITGEISSIYKKNGRVRKVHSLIILPSLEDAERLSAKLETIGNIHSDGRPILGIDCHDLLEITMELCPRAIYVPAHIWTPHFSLFGAFSGFDTVEECFEDMTPYVHAMETGLSSDPAMNWRLSALDSYQLISNSDAHSPSKLGREANLLSIDLSYSGMYGAIQEGRGLEGTIEFFPEEGKYHYDGHRKCNLCLSPSQALQYHGKCPVCGRKLTIGVSHRVEELADRAEGYTRADSRPYESLVPLPEVIGASTGHSSAGRKVQEQYQEMLSKIGPEFSILREVPTEEIRRVSGYLVAEGIRRLREGKVERFPGFDGEYGTIKLFERSEIDNLDGQLSFFTAADYSALAAKEAAAARPWEMSGEMGRQNGMKMAEEIVPRTDEIEQVPVPEKQILNSSQERAVKTAARALAVIAGPGTGKTKTLVSRILYLLNERRVKPSEITAVTFTKKAAKEMEERLKQQMGGRSVRAMRIGTFHALCYRLLKSQDQTVRMADELETLEAAEEIIREYGLKLTARKFLSQVSGRKTGMSKEILEPQFEKAMEDYGERLKEAGVLDFDDLILETLHLLQSEKQDEIRSRNFAYLLVDEFQDISPLQYQLIQAWNQDGRELFVIGDPDQSIYGFRGSDARCFDRLAEDYPELVTVRLIENYRSTPQIVLGAASVISQNEGQVREISPHRQDGAPIRIVTAASELSEAIFAAKEVNRLIGGIDMLDAQTRGEVSEEKASRSFADIAVLYRTHRQAALLEKCLSQEGIPYVVTGRDDFLTEPPVNGTLCFFRYLLDPEDTMSRKLSCRLLWDPDHNDHPDTICSAMAERYLPLVKKTKPQKLLSTWMKEMDLTENDAMKKLLSMSLFYKNMEELLEELAFGQEGDLKRCGGKSYTADAVTLMTLHGSKGLEYPVVILCGARKGMIPLENGKQPVDLEEERRLFYVGMTRAKEELIITSSQEPSEFLADIPQEYLHREQAQRPKNQDSGKQLSLFDFI